MRELEFMTDRLPQPLHISTRPSMTFHGNIQVAVSEARSIVEQGGRVVFFAPSTGELERLADILQEYRIPFQLGIDTSDTTPPYLAETRLSGRDRREHVSRQRLRFAAA